MSIARLYETLRRQPDADTGLCTAHDAILSGVPVRDGFGLCSVCRQRVARSYAADTVVVHGPKSISGRQERESWRMRIEDGIVAVYVETSTGLPYDIAAREFLGHVLDAKRKVEEFVNWPEIDLTHSKRAR